MKLSTVKPPSDTKKMVLKRHLVQQGGPESLSLLNLYIDFVMRLVLEKCHSDQNIDFFIHKYRINYNSISREKRLSMRKDKLSQSGTSSFP